MRPVIWSTSALVTTTALIGELRFGPDFTGWSSGVSLICLRMSGEALSNTQLAPSAETASEDCSLALYPATPARTLAECKPLQFHCGNPPPAADPRTLMIIDFDMVTRSGSPKPAALSFFREVKRLRRPMRPSTAAPGSH